MPFPKAMTRFNSRVANPVLRHLAVRAPMMGVVHHRGRRSGKPYETPVLLFRGDDTVVMALTYGRDVDWAKNVLAAGGCTVRSRGQNISLTNSVIRRDDTGSVQIPAPIRWVLGAASVHDYLHLTLRDQ